MTQNAGPHWTRKPRRGLAFAVTAAFLGLLALAWLLLPDATRSWLLAAVTSVEGMEAAIAEAGMFAPLASIGLMVAHSLIPFPAEMLAIANGMVFGLALGVFVTWSGAMLGALFAWWLARRFGQEWVRKLLGEQKWRRLESAMENVGPRALILARLTPVISFNLVNYAAGLAGVPLWTFLWTTAIGILPITTAGVLVGSHMISAPWPFWAALFAGVAGLMLLHWRFSRR